MKKTKKIKIKFINQIKWKNIIFKIANVIIILILSYNLLYFLNTTITKKKYIDICGLSFFCMESNMMSPELNPNDLIIIKNTKEVFAGENIAYYVTERNIRINKLSQIIHNADKESFITKSNNAYHYDKEEITRNQIIGKQIYCIPFLGIIAKVLETKIVTTFGMMYLIIKFWYNKKQIERRKR